MEIKLFREVPQESLDQDVNKFVGHCDSSEDPVLVLENETPGLKPRKIYCPILGKETVLEGIFCLDDSCRYWTDRAF